jgi:hypothetical protein
MNYICNNFIFATVNKILVKSIFLRNVLDPHLARPSSLYTIGGDQRMKKLALGHYILHSI